MAIDDNLVWSLRRMPVVSQTTWQVVFRGEAGFGNPLGGINEFSLATWLVAGSTANAVYQQNTVTGGGRMWYLYRYPDTSIDKFRFDVPLVSGNQTFFSANNSGGTDGADTLVVITRSGTALNLYVDGSFVETFAIASGNTDAHLTAQNCNIGTTSGTGCPVHALHAWNRVITADEVADLYAAGAGGWPSSGVGTSGFTGIRGVNRRLGT